MNRRLELTLVTLLLLLAALLRVWDLTRLPPGFSNEELAYIRMSQTVRQGEVAVYYQVGDGQGHAGLFAVLTTVSTHFTGGGLLGYRLLPLWGGLLAAALLYALARRLFGVPVALIALGMFAVNFRAILLARSVSAQSLMPAYILLVLLLLTLGFNVRPVMTFKAPRTWTFALMAVLFGVGAYLHYTALLLAPLAVIFLVHLLMTHQPLSRRIWSLSVFVIVLATIVGTPYLISTLRDTPLSEPYVLWSQRPHSVKAVVDGALHAISGVIWHGDVSPSANLPRLPWVGPVTALLLITGAAVSIRRWREPRYMLILLSLAGGLLLDTWVSTTPTFSANLVALPAVYILPGIGVLVVVNWLRGRGMAQVWQTAAAALVVMLVVNVVAVRAHLFNDYRHDAAVFTAYHANLGYLAAYLDRTPNGLPVEVCAAGKDTPGDTGLSPRQMLRLMQHRHHMLIRHADCQSGLVLINAGAPMRLAFASDRDPALMPPELAEWLSDAQPIPVEGLPKGSVVRLDVEQRVRDAGGQWQVLSPVSFFPDSDGHSAPVALPVQLEQNLTFAGYDPRVFEGERVPGGDPIVLVTYWRVDGPLPPGLGIFAHLLAYSQNDPPVPLLEPWAESNTINVIPKELRNRDIFIQVSYLWLSQNLTPGSYALTVGAYNGTVTILEQHLNVLDPSRDYQPHGDRLWLGDFVVSPADDGGDGGASADSGASGAAGS